MIPFYTMNKMFKKAYSPSKIENLSYDPCSWKLKAPAPQPQVKLATQEQIDAAFELLSPTDFLAFCMEQDALREKLDQVYGYSPLWKQEYLGVWGSSEPTDPTPKTVKIVNVKVGDHVVAKYEPIKTHFKGRFA